MADCCQVIDGDGGFHEEELAAFVEAQGVLRARTDYQIVAIMGPQSSGKSTLMNTVVRNHPHSSRCGKPMAALCRP